MFIKLFDVQDGVLIPSEYSMTLSSLRRIREKYPVNYIRIFLYIFYTSCPDPEQNPFFNLPEEDKDAVILKEIEADFSTDEPLIAEAIKLATQLYDTPTNRAYQGAKAMMDKLASLFKNQQLTASGKDSSLTPMLGALEKYNKLRDVFKGVEKDYMDEIKAVTRGGSYSAYDDQ